MCSHFPGSTKSWKQLRLERDILFHPTEENSGGGVGRRGGGPGEAGEGPWDGCGAPGGTEPRAGKSGQPGGAAAGAGVAHTAPQARAARPRQGRGARRRAPAGGLGSPPLLPPALLSPPPAGAGSARLFFLISCCLYALFVTPSSLHGVSLSRLQAGPRQPSALHCTSRAAAGRGGTWRFPPRRLGRSPRRLGKHLSLPGFRC